MGNRIAKHIYSATGEFEKSTYYVRDASGNVMATYESKEEPEGQWSYMLIERHIYGSSRLGMDIETVELVDPIPTTQDPIQRTLGRKQYEISNHLGNVLSVITDIKLPVLAEDGTTIISYTAVVISATDYSAFGVALYGRTWSSDSYRYGFNGVESDYDISGISNTYFTEFRILDSRLGRWFSIDPLAMKYTWQSPYVSMDNNPICLMDPQGLGTNTEPKKHKVQKGDTYSKIAKKNNVTVDELRKWNGYEDTKIPIGTELIVSDPTVAINAQKYEEYKTKYTKQHTDGKIGILATMVGQSSTLFGGPFDSNMSEASKECYFNNDASCTLGILMMEFATGTGYGHHKFDEKNPVTEQVKWSIQAKLFTQWFCDEWRNGNIVEGKIYYKRIKTSPDRTNASTAISSHFFNTNAGVFFQGMEFTAVLSAGVLSVRATDRYSIASGLTRNEADNLERVPGYLCPFGTTSMEFNFSYPFLYKK